MLMHILGARTQRINSRITVGAVLDYNKCIELYPSARGCYNNRALIREKLQDYRGAIQDYTKLIELNPVDADYYFMRAEIKIEIEDYYGAVKDCNKIIELDSSKSMRASAFSLIGNAKRGLEDYNGAIQGDTKVIELEPNNWSAYFGRAYSKSMLKDYWGAIGVSKAIELNPKNGTSYYNRGIDKREVGDYIGACKDFKKALEVGYSDRSGWCKRHVDECK